MRSTEPLAYLPEHSFNHSSEKAIDMDNFTYAQVNNSDFDANNETTRTSHWTTNWNISQLYILTLDS